MEMLNLVGLELESAIVGGALDVNEIASYDDGLENSENVKINSLQYHK